jgi:pimeloyl-ACP methyl ester carboxylesterase
MVARMATSLHALPDGAALSYTDRGRGRPLLLLHGVTMTSRFFERNVDALAEEHRVVAIDFRSHGASPNHEGGHTVAQYARDLRHLIEALDLRDVVLVGWSMGSMVAWDYLRQFRGDHRVAGHVVVSQSPSDLKRDDWEHGFLDVDGLVEFLREAQEDWAAALGGFAPAMFMDERSAEELAWMAEEMGKVGANAGTAILLDQTFRDYRADLAQVDVPTLLAWGRDEKLVPVSAGEEMARRIPDAELRFFERSGHCPMYEEPEAFNAAVAAFAARLP